MTSAEPMRTATPPNNVGERADLLDTLRKHRYFLRRTVRGLTDDQAAVTPTASSLCLGGLIKHVTWAERQWTDFIVHGPAAMNSGGKSPAEWDESDYAAHHQTFRMGPGETLAAIQADYDGVARRTDELVATSDLDATQPLPQAPWFEPGARWSARRVLLHIAAETAQHAGHADIIRETIDGAKSMG
jgi:hypothetical protein